MYIMCPQHTLGNFSKCFRSILKTLAQNGNVLQVTNLDRTKDPLHPEELVDQRSEGFTKGKQMADLFGMIQNVDKPTFIHHQQRCVSEGHHNYNSPLPLLSTLLQQCPINDWLIEGDLHMFTESVNAKKFKELKCHIRLLMPEHSWA